MQTISLSQNQLAKLMNLLKESMISFNRQCSSNVTFFNDWCLYRHIRSFPVPHMPGKKRKYATIGALLDILEPYIPFRLTEENFDLFMDAVFLPEEPGPQLFHKARLDFIISLRAIKNPSQWEQVLAVCETIRAVKEEMAISQV